MNIVLDLNVLYSAWTMKNPNNSSEYDISALALIKDVLNCKHNIFVTAQIEKEYTSRFNEWSKDNKKLSITNLSRLYFLAKNSGKVKNKGSNQCSFGPIPEEDKVKDEDKKFARLAYHTDAFLITFDGPLRDVMKSKARCPNELIKI